MFRSDAALTYLPHGMFPSPVFRHPSRADGSPHLLGAIDEEVEVTPLVGLQHVVEVEPFVAATRR